MSNQQRTLDNKRTKSQSASTNVGPPPLADPDDPFRVQRSHLEKMELGKSSSSCKLSFVTRLHSAAMLQEFWCASFEEACVYENIAAHPDVVNFKEQFTCLDYIDEAGNERFTHVDLTMLLADGAQALVSVKYDEKARRKSYLAEVANIAAQCSPEIADRFIVVSRYSFHPIYRKCAQQIHVARRGWDPEADLIILESANELVSATTLEELVDQSKLGERGWRAAIRMIGDGKIQKHRLDPITNTTMCWSARV
jgi:hypothetical protein